MKSKYWLPLSVLGLLGACTDSASPKSDAAPPVVRGLTISSLDDSTAVVEGTVTDDVGVMAVEWWVSDPLVHAPAQITPGREAHFRVVLPSRRSGARNVVRIQAFDAAGHVTDTSTAHLFGPKRPSVTLAGLPLGGTTLRGRGIAITASILANSPLARVDSLVVLVDAGTASEQRAAYSLGGAAQATYDALLRGPFANGTHAVTVRLVGTSFDQSDGYVPRSDTTFTVTTQVDDAPYTLAVLESPRGGETRARDVNVQGDVIGLEVGVQPVRWLGGRMVALSNPPGLSAYPVAINDSGYVVGYLLPGSCVVPIWWAPDGMRSTMLDATEQCGGSAVAAPVAINDRGIVLLNALTGNVPALVDVRSRAAVALVPAAAAGVGFVGLNDSRTVTGFVSSDGLRTTIGALWRPTLTSFNCPHVGPLLSVFGREQCVLGEINDDGDAVGNVSGHPFVRRGNGDLTSLTPALLTIPAVSINARGQVLAFDSAATTAYLWQSGAVSRVRLDTDGWRLTSVVRINDVGQIAGDATQVATGARRAVLLTPVR